MGGSGAGISMVASASLVEILKAREAGLQELTEDARRTRDTVCDALVMLVAFCTAMNCRKRLEFVVVAFW